MKRLAVILCCLSFLVPAGAGEVGIRIRFGLTDRENTKWDGTVTVSPGRVARIDGWRFQQQDTVEGTSGWKASTRPLTLRRSNNPKKGGKASKKGGGGLLADNGVILLLEGVTEDSVVDVKMAPGNFRFKLSDVPYGKTVDELDRSVEVERVAASRPLTEQKTDDDFPAIAIGPEGNVYVAYVSFTPGLDRDERAKTWDKEPADMSFLAKPTGGDQLWLRMQTAGKWGEPVALTPGKGDLYKCAVAVDGQGTAWVFWSEQKDANFDIWARPVKNGAPGEPLRISTDQGSDVNPAAATDNQGHVWVAWQGARGNVFRIQARRQTAGGWGKEFSVSTQKGNCWMPAVAASAVSGSVAIAWDTYDKGDYDVWVREYASDGKAQAARPAANSPLYEARPSAAYDREGNLWLSWEESGATWGKDWGAYERNTGIGLYKNRQIGLRVLSKGKWLDPAASFLSSLPAANPRRGVKKLPVRRPEPEITTRAPGKEAENAPAGSYNNLARIACDRDGRVWLFARAREGQFHTPLGSVWMNYVSYFDGKNWVGPVLLPHSDNLLYNLPAVAAHPDGGLIVAHSSDHRQDRHLMRRGAGGNASLDSDRDPFINDVFVSRLEFARHEVTPAFKAAAQVPASEARPSADTVKERQEVARIRAYRMKADGHDLRILRGEFHRHTEISGDGGNDGPLEDMWRYAIDAASMDWIGNGDHDNGGGREYTWWLTQKTTDAYHLPGAFDPMFSYERSVRYPEGHRNPVFAQRGVRTLPRLPISARDFTGHAPDTQMLYKYLKLFGGICAEHTSATGMGTDWRDWDPEVEPMVEIYQGARQNYERPGAPRSPTANDAAGGWEPKGFVNLALLKGYRLAFESSSDHGSTHISYCLLYSEGTSREQILKAMKAHHSYAATDNIIADYRCTMDGHEYMLGDAFTASQPPTLRLKLVGTAPFAKVTLVKDDVEVKTWEPGKAEVEITWTDPNPTPGKTSYYYFRGEQSLMGTETDGELVWASPMWITYRPK